MGKLEEYEGTILELRSSLQAKNEENMKQGAQIRQLKVQL